MSACESWGVSEGENGRNLKIRCRWIKLKYFFML
jgi:hypothetical protein